MKKNSFIFLVLGFILILSSCDKRSTERGRSYLPDMEKSRAYDTYSENPNFEDSMTLRKPVEGTIPRGVIPYPLKKTDEDMLLAGRKYFNPLEINEENLAKGKLQFKRFCSHCHGEKGDGQGYLYTSKKYAYPPANLLQDKTVNRPEGEIYHIINVGIKIMGSHASQLSQEDRWRVVMYIREDLQKKK